MISRNQTTKVELDVNKAFTRSASERADEHKRRQKQLDAERNHRNMQYLGWAIGAVLIALLTGVAI